MSFFLPLSVVKLLIQWAGIQGILERCGARLLTECLHLLWEQNGQLDPACLAPGAVCASCSKVGTRPVINQAFSWPLWGTKYLPLLFFPLSFQPYLSGRHLDNTYVKSWSFFLITQRFLHAKEQWHVWQCHLFQVVPWRRGESWCAFWL